MTVVAAVGSTRLGTLRAVARAEMQASIDLLTGLSNRRACEERISRLVAGSHPGSPALVEIGGLIQLNARHGNDRGDHAIRLFSDVLRQSVGPGDWCGRWTGSQFVVVLGGTSSVVAHGRMSVARNKITEAFETAGLSGLVVRVGVAGSAGVGDTRTMISAAGAVLDTANPAGSGADADQVAPTEPVNTRDDRFVVVADVPPSYRWHSALESANANIRRTK